MHCWLWLAWWISSWPYLFLLKHPLHKAPGGMVVISAVVEHFVDFCSLKWNGGGEERKDIQRWLHFPSLKQTWVWKWCRFLDAKNESEWLLGAVFRFRWSDGTGFWKLETHLRSRMAQQLLNLSSEFWHVWPPALSCLETYTKHVKKINLSPMRSTCISFLILISSVSFVQFVFWRSSGDAAPLKALSYCVWCVWWNPYGRFGWCEVCTSSEVFEAWRHMKLPTLDPWMVDLPTFSYMYH